MLEVEYRAVRRKPPKDNPDNRRGRRCGYLPVLKVAYEKEVKGCVSCVRQLQDHVLCAVSNRVEVYLLDPSGKLLQIEVVDRETCVRVMRHVDFAFLNGCESEGLALRW